jgi:AraC family transcriptional regulator
VVIDYRIVSLPAFDVVGKSMWISGQDSGLFGRFWERCRQDGTLDVLRQIMGSQAGKHTKGFVLGVSCVEQDPSNRAFAYMIAIEKPDGVMVPEGLESHRVSAARWAAFECRGEVPESIVQTEMYVFTEWLPASRYTHAFAPEMEVYLGDGGCEFWLPIADS